VQQHVTTNTATGANSPAATTGGGTISLPRQLFSEIPSTYSYPGYAIIADEAGIFDDLMLIASLTSQTSSIINPRLPN
jgi:hypothetical protein